MRLRWWRRRSLVCRQAVALMGDFIDGRLADRDRARLEEHLSACPHCSEYLSQLRVTVDALGRVQPGVLSDEALDDLVTVYRQWRAESG
jgi:anti-sigma factor RsiW